MIPRIMGKQEIVCIVCRTVYQNSILEDLTQHISETVKFCVFTYRNFFHKMIINYVYI